MGNGGSKSSKSTSDSSKCIIDTSKRTMIAIHHYLADRTASALFEDFYERMQQGAAIQGIDLEPMITLRQALMKIAGDGAPFKEELNAGCEEAEARADLLLRLGPDEYNLTRDEIAAIHLYTQEVLYKSLNRALWSTDPGAVRPYWAYLKLLQHALFKLPKCTTGVIYRGIKDPYEPITEQNMIARAAASGGSGELVWWGFSSCSTDLQAVKTFFGDTGYRVLYTIENGSAARDVSKYSKFPDEAEVLLPFGSAFKVKTAAKMGDVLVVTLEQMHEFVYSG